MEVRGEIHILAFFSEGRAILPIYYGATWILESVTKKTFLPLPAVQPEISPFTVPA
jgi:hypothetical protein